MNPQPFPWHLVDRATHEGARGLRDARRWLSHRCDSEPAVRRLAEIIDAEISFRVRSAKIGPVSPTPGFLAVVFSSGQGGDESFAVVLEDALAATVASRAMKRKPPRVFDATRAAPDALAGALGAILAAAARSGKVAPLTISWCGAANELPASLLAPAVVDVHALVLVDHDAFEAHLLVSEDAARRSAGSPFSQEILASLGDLPISLQVVAAAVALDQAELDALSARDVLVLGGSLRLRGAKLTGETVVAASASDRGARARLGEDRSLVILEGSEEIVMVAPEETVAENAGQSPIIVRVEVGSVTMKAREWAALKPGDVIATGQKIADSIVLRVGGVEVARGELVEIEGEVGVRIVSRS